MADVYKTHLAHNTRKEAKKGVPVNPAIPVGNYETDFHDYRAESPNSQTGEKVKHQLLSQLQVDSLTAQMERLRVSLRERDIEIVKLKAENSMLKQARNIMYLTSLARLLTLQIFTLFTERKEKSTRFGEFGE